MRDRVDDFNNDGDDDDDKQEKEKDVRVWEVKRRR